MEESAGPLPRTDFQLQTSCCFRATTTFFCTAIVGIGSENQTNRKTATPLREAGEALLFFDYSGIQLSCHPEPAKDLITAEQLAVISIDSERDKVLRKLRMTND